MDKICILGTHGSAKTSLVYKLAAYYKMNGINVTVIHETARKSPFPLNEGVVPQTTIHVMSMQLQKELEAEAQGFQLAICDRSIGDAPIYINKVGKGNEWTAKMEEFAMVWAKTYNVMVLLEPSEGIKLMGDGIRAEDVGYQMEIRDEFRKLVNGMQETLGDDLNLIEAESKQVFDRDMCEKLMDEIDACRTGAVCACV